MDKNLAKKKKLSNSNREGNVEAEEIPGIMDEKAAEEKIQHFFILKAWRNQKEKNKRLEGDVKNLTNQVDSLQLQIYALKHLLDAERTRVVNFNNDFRKILTSLDESNHEKQLLVEEKEQMEARLHQMEEKLVGLEMDCKNQKNELLTARSEAQTWEKQLEKEREKLSKMKDERKFFIEEVRFKGNLLVRQIRSFEQFSRFFNVLQSKPNNPALPWDETAGRIDPKPETFKKPKKQKKQQTVPGNPQENPELKTFHVKVGRKTQEEDERIEELEKSILGKTKLLITSAQHQIKWKENQNYTNIEAEILAQFEENSLLPNRQTEV